MKKKLIWGIGVFIAVTLVAYFIIFSGKEVAEIGKFGFSAFCGGIAGIIASLLVKDDED